MWSLAERSAYGHLKIRREAPMAPAPFHTRLFCKLIKLSFGRKGSCTVFQTESGKHYDLWGFDAWKCGFFTGTLKVARLRGGQAGRSMLVKIYRSNEKQESYLYIYRSSVCVSMCRNSPTQIPTCKLAFKMNVHLIIPYWNILGWAAAGVGSLLRDLVGGPVKQQCGQKAHCG